MDRILQNTPQVITATLYSGSTATDPSPDSATIEVLRADGTALVAAGTSASENGTGSFKFALTAAQLAQLDVLTARWTMNVGTTATITTRAEVVGGFLCSLTELKGVFPTKTDAELTAIRTASEQRLENACHRAFVPRYALEARSARPWRFRLAWPDVRAIRYASVGGTALTSTQLSYLDIGPGGYVTGLPRRGTIGYSRTVIGYEHGADYPSEVIREGVLLAAEETFASDSSDALVIRREADNQAVTFASPSSGGSFQNPTLRRIVRDHGTPLVA